eukprot:scaffold873_cov252-Pinguiococcus_pyrenoidosus.AAC.19
MQDGRGGGVRGGRRHSQRPWSCQSLRCGHQTAGTQGHVPCMTPHVRDSQEGSARGPRRLQQRALPPLFTPRISVSLSAQIRRPIGSFAARERPNGCLWVFRKNCLRIPLSADQLAPKASLSQLHWGSLGPRRSWP